MKMIIIFGGKMIRNAIGYKIKGIKFNQKSYIKQDMGNSNQDKNLKCGIRHIIDPRADGDWLAGTVFIQTLKPIEQGALFLRIAGKQTCQWTEQESDGTKKNHTRTVYYNGSHDFYIFQQKLADFGTNINTGMYEVRFQFRLPKDLPPSFRFNEGAIASVEYKMECVFRHPVSPKTLEYPQELVINLTSRLPETRPYQRTINEMVKCCGIDKGRVRGQLFLDKTDYSVGNTAMMTLRLEAMQKNISGINVKLLKVATLTGVNGRGHTKTRSFYEEMQAFKLPGVNMIGIKEDQLLRIELGGSRDKIINPTYLGPVVKVFYQLYVEFDMEGGCSGSAELYLPIKLLNEKYIPPVQAFVFDLPPNWTPQAMPMVSFGYQPYVPPQIPYPESNAYLQ